MSYPRRDVSWGREDSTRSGPCGESVIIAGRGEATDGEGHPIRMVHAAYVSRLERAVGAIRMAHTKDPEGFIPRCAADGEPFPCSTLRLMFPGEVWLP